MAGCVSKLPSILLERSYIPSPQHEGFAHQSPHRYCAKGTHCESQQQSEHKKPLTDGEAKPEGQAEQHIEAAKQHTCEGVLTEVGQLFGYAVQQTTTCGRR